MARPRSANRRRFVLVLVVLTSLTLITLDSRSGRTGPLGIIGRVAHSIVSPVQRATSSIASPIGDWFLDGLAYLLGGHHDRLGESGDKIPAPHLGVQLLL